MKNYLLVLLIALVGCSNEQSEEVKSKLVDPDSMQVKRQEIVKDASCVEYNAKNRMGGYMGTQTSLLIYSEGKWVTTVALMQLDYETCIRIIRK